MRVKTIILLFVLAGLQAVAQSPLSARWDFGRNNARPGQYSSRFVFKNVSGKPLDTNWQLFFNQFSRAVTLPADCPVDIDMVSTTYYRVRPNKRYRQLAPGDSLVVEMLMKGTFFNRCYAPMGGHVVMDGDMKHPLAVNIAKNALDRPEQWVEKKNFPNGEHVYARNRAINDSTGLRFTPYDIFPAPKQVRLTGGVVAVPALVAVNDPFRGARARNFLVEELAGRGIYNAGGAGRLPVKLRVDKKLSANHEAYRLQVDSAGITITGASDDGLMNGAKTLLAALDHSTGYKLPAAVVDDAPDLHYRGFMLDIARNFTPLPQLKRFVDILSYYKINTWQFHFTDDEGWRVEIPGLPELTTVTSRRGCTLDESEYLAQIFDGNGNPDDRSQSANGFLTTDEFVDLLKYARSRGVKVIPEIETPGHARAAIVAMKARYNRLRATDSVAATQFVLWDPEERATYESTQNYKNNVLNPAQEGTYRFLDKVVTELAAMYRRAGLKLDIVHLGGDEVARQAWDNSPAVKRLMAQHGFTTTHQVSEHYIGRISDILYRRGIKIEGWQEIALDHSKEFNDVMTQRVAGVNAWSTIGRNSHVPYTVANSGYPTIISNESNFYIDFGYNWHPEEPGLHWGGCVDEFNTWQAQPFNIYSTSWVDLQGDSIDFAAAAAGKPALAQPQNIIGVQGQLWAETLRNFDMVQYFCLPKMMGLVERGWNARPQWAQSLERGDRAPVAEAMRRYNLQIGLHELPMLRRGGFTFHVPQPGIHITGGKNPVITCNGAYPGMEIHYTTTGEEPTLESPVWQRPVALPAGCTMVKARAYFLDRASVTTCQPVSRPAAAKK